jgi:hypothetical protein
MNAWLPIAIFYLVYFVLLPMLAMSTNKWVCEAEGAERSKRYWQGVRWASAMFHVGTILAVLLMWVLHPYMFPAQ